MSKAVLISIRPKWCELIASGKKTIEVRKTAPKIETPFKCYIYCTKEGRGVGEIPYRHFYQASDGPKHFMGGTVIGEFVCDRIYGIVPDENGWGEEYGYSEHDCLSDAEMAAYLGDHSGFGWHISDLSIYEGPKELSDFMRKPCDMAASCGACIHAIREDINGFAGVPVDCEFAVQSPPQSWCYVEEI